MRCCQQMISWKVVVIEGRKKDPGTHQSSYMSQHCRMRADAPGDLTKVSRHKDDDNEEEKKKKKKWKKLG